VSRSTVVIARKQLAKEARKEARKQARKASRETTKAPEPRQRAQRFLKDMLADGPKPVSSVEAAAKAHVHSIALEQARADLAVVTSRGNTGGAAAGQGVPPGWGPLIPCSQSLDKCEPSLVTM